MNTRFMTIIAFLTIFLLTACNQEKPPEQTQTLNPNMTQFGNSLTLDFKADPSPVAVGKPIKLSVNVKRQADPATDATVQFEVWEKNSKEKHQLLDAKPDGQGVYSISQTYQQEGEYLVVVHVTAPNVHQMIDGKFQVGQAQDTEKKE